MNCFPHTNFLRGEKFHSTGIIKTCKEQNFHVGLQVFREGFSDMVGGPFLWCFLLFAEVLLCQWSDIPCLVFGVCLALVPCAVHCPLLVCSRNILEQWVLLCSQEFHAALLHCPSLPGSPNYPFQTWAFGLPLLSRTVFVLFPSPELCLDQCPCSRSCSGCPSSPLLGRVLPHRHIALGDTFRASIAGSVNRGVIKSLLKMVWE